MYYMAHRSKEKVEKAIITEFLPSKDGQIRQCKIKMDTVETTRPVNQLYSLEITADEFTEAGKQESTSGSVIVPEVIQQGTENKVQTSPLSVRPKRVAALVALEKNRELMLQNHYFK